MTAVPSAILGNPARWWCGALVTHSSSATNNARQGGVGLFGLRGLTQSPGLGSTPGRVGRIAPGSSRLGVRSQGKTDLRIRLRKINRRQCEAAHTSLRDRRAIGAPTSGFRWGSRAVEGAMMRTNLSIKSAPRVELDERSRAARLRRERIDRLLIPPVAVTQSRLRRLLCVFSFGMYGGAA
jgi:hypothetical protein